MAETNFPDTLITTNNHEKDQSQVKVILIRGLEDLNEATTKLLGTISKTDIFNPQWRTDESLVDKASRLDGLVQSALNEGKQPIVIGISAGAAMMEAYMLMYPDKIRHGYSLSGLLNPNFNEINLDHLTSTSPGFKQVAEYLTDNLTPEAIKRLQLPLKISAYNSPDDTIVPLAASHPSWLKNFRSVGRGDHLESIIRALAGDIRRQASQFAHADFN